MVQRLETLGKDFVASIALSDPALWMFLTSPCHLMWRRKFNCNAIKWSRLYMSCDDQDEKVNCDL